MALFWRLQDIPELQPLDKDQRTKVWMATTGRRIRDPLLLLLLIPFFIVVGLGYYLGGLLVPWKLGSSLGGGFGAGLAILLFMPIALQRSRAYIVEELRRRSPE